MDDIFWEDYYAVLQVNYNAEPDIITGAYRLLSKKYHPDLNRSREAEAKMKLVNIAYNVLGDERRRAEYNAEWLRRTGNENRRQWDGACSVTGFYDESEYNKARQKNEQVLVAREQAEKYYGHIKNGDYDAAYDCISLYDKKNIRRADFRKWREEIGRRYELRSYSAEFFKCVHNLRANKKLFDDAYEFTVRICERDVASNRYTDYKNSKIVVVENGRYGVYLGYADVKQFIKEYADGGQDVVDTNAAIEYWHRDRAIHDELTGLYNLSGFIDTSKSEISRYNRHKSPFSIVLFEVREETSPFAVIKGAGDAGLSGSGDTTRNGSSCAIAKALSGVILKARKAACPRPPDKDILELTGRFLSVSLRDLDAACRLKDGKFAALLAETDMQAAYMAVNRICRDYNRLFLSANERRRYHAMYAGVCEYDSRSVVSTLKKCSANLAITKLSGRLSVAKIVTWRKNLNYTGDKKREKFKQRV